MITFVLCNILRPVAYMIPQCLQLFRLLAELSHRCKVSTNGKHNSLGLGKPTERLELRAQMDLLDGSAARLLLKRYYMKQSAAWLDEEIVPLYGL